MDGAPERQGILGVVLRFRWRTSRPPKSPRIVEESRLRFPFVRRQRADASRSRRLVSDARPAESGSEARSGESRLRRLIRLRLRPIAALLVLLFVTGLAVAVFAERGWVDLRHARNELNDLAARVEAQQATVVALRREVQLLTDDPSAVESIAREELGYARPGEIIFLLPNEGADRSREVPGRRPEASRRSRPALEAPGSGKGPS